MAFKVLVSSNFALDYNTRVGISKPRASVDTNTNMHKIMRVVKVSVTDTLMVSVTDTLMAL